jgi:hypothetical protein
VRMFGQLSGTSQHAGTALDAAYISDYGPTIQDKQYDSEINLSPASSRLIADWPERNSHRGWSIIKQYDGAAPPQFLAQWLTNACIKTHRHLPDIPAWASLCRVVVPCIVARGPGLPPTFRFQLTP